MLLARYLLAVCGLTLTGIMMTGNIMFAYAMVSGASIIAQIMFTTISVVADIIPIAMVIIMPRQHAARKMWHVLAAMAIWLITSGFAIYSCGEWFKTTFEPAEVAQQRSVENAKSIETKITAERQQLAAANQIALTATTQMKRADAIKEAEATRKRITELEERKWPASTVPASILKHGFRGWEIQAALVVFMLAQACWWFAFDDTEPEVEPAEPQPTQKWLSTGHSDLLKPQRNHSFEPKITLAINDNGRGEPVDNQWRTSDEPVTNQCPPILPSGKPVAEPVGGTVHAFVPEPPSIGDRVERMIKDGCSERTIEAALGIKRSQVRRIKIDRGVMKMAAQ